MKTNRFELKDFRLNEILSMLTTYNGPSLSEELNRGSSSKPPSLIDGEANLFKLGAFDRGLKSVESSRER